MQYSEKEYLDALHNKPVEGIREGEDRSIYNLNIVIEHNIELINSYPWLSHNLVWLDDGTFVISDDENYAHTWLDSMPDGWRINFGLDLCCDIKQELSKYDYNNKYCITDIKEKFGVLAWYDHGYPKESKVWKILDYYEDLSMRVCMDCGKPTEWTVDDPYWIYYYCDDCKKKLEADNPSTKFVRIDWERLDD